MLKKDFGEKDKTALTVAVTWLVVGIVGLVASQVMKWEGSFLAALVFLSAGIAGFTSFVYDKLLKKKKLVGSLRIVLVVVNFILTTILVYLLAENLFSSLIN